MKVLLVANPMTVMGFDRMVRLPNLGLNSIAANIDKRMFEVKIVDLVLAGKNPREYYKNLLVDYQPDIVGLSCMSFQYQEALALARLTKMYNKNSTVVIGGYHPTVDYETILESKDMDVIDFLVRNEGEVTFDRLTKALKSGDDLRTIPNLSYRANGDTIHNLSGGLVNLDELKRPNRDARILKKGFKLFGYPADVIEMTRGCVFDCNFCSITKMYGKSLRKYPIQRIIEDIKDVIDRGAKAIMLADDNTTIDGKHLKKICEAIIDAGLNKVKYYVQANIKGIKHTPGLAEIMVKAGCKWIFLGLESGSEQTLAFYDKKNQFDIPEAFEVVKELKSHGAFIFGGMIIGNPDDTEETIWASYTYAKNLGVDVPIFGILTPYPNTPLRDILIQQGLVTNLYDYSKYTGFEANVKTNYLSSEQLYHLREELGSRYPVDSGAIWRVLREFSTFLPKVVLTEFVRDPMEILVYLKGILSRGITVKSQ